MPLARPSRGSLLLSSSVLNIRSQVISSPGAESVLDELPGTGF